MKSPVLTLLCILTVFGLPTAQAQWLEWDVQTESRMELFTVANSDEEEKESESEVGMARFRLKSGGDQKRPFWPIPRAVDDPCGFVLPSLYFHHYIS